MKHVYLFSGLGADQRVFQFLDLSGFSITCIEWIAHAENETIAQYAKRITNQITTANPILIGVSFGGMMAVEVAKLIPTEKILVISSAKTRKELPDYFQATGKPTLLRIIPDWLLIQPNPVNHWLFGTESGRDKKLLNEILRDTNPRFLRWALTAIATWQNDHLHPNLKHIHGKKDKILPHRYVCCDFTVEDGGHFMIVNRADEVNALVREMLVE